MSHLDYSKKAKGGASYLATSHPPGIIRKGQGGEPPELFSILNNLEVRKGFKAMFQLQWKKEAKVGEPPK